MTDGISQDSVRRPALALRSKGVLVLALGIGTRYRRSQLQQIATNSRYVFTSHFRKLNQVARRISSKICRSKFCHWKTFIFHMLKQSKVYQAYPLFMFRGGAVGLFRRTFVRCTPCGFHRQENSLHDAYSFFVPIYKLLSPISKSVSYQLIVIFKCKKSLSCLKKWRRL